MLCIVRQHVSLSSRIPHKMSIKYIFLLKHFHRIKFRIWLHLDQINLSKRAFAYQLYRDEHFRPYLFSQLLVLFHHMLVLEQLDFWLKMVLFWVVSHGRVRFFEDNFLTAVGFFLCFLLSFKLSSIATSNQRRISWSMCCQHLTLVFIISKFSKCLLFINFQRDIRTFLLTDVLYRLLHRILLIRRRSSSNRLFRIPISWD